MKFFLWAAYNAYVQLGFVKLHSPTGKRSFTFHLFIERLCESAFGRRISETSSHEKRLKLDAHHDVEKPEHAISNQRCRVCREKYLKAKKANPGAKDKDLPNGLRECSSIGDRYVTLFHVFSLIDYSFMFIE